MMRACLGRARQVGLAALCAVLLGIGMTAPAQADVEPIFVFTPVPDPPKPAEPPPEGLLEDPCGLAVDSAGNFYVSDYYHDAVDVFDPTTFYIAQLPEVDPIDGPCGIALNSAGDLFVNDYHRLVARYAPSLFPPVRNSTTYSLAATIDPVHPTAADAPTGVAVDQVDRIYVDNRTYVAVYEASGAPVEVSGEPLQIGAGSLGNGYGIAVSAYPATAGYVYVPDAATDTVKVYDPAADPSTPVTTIDGHENPTGGFVSLRDSAVAVDRVSGNVYVADNLQQGVAEEPETAIYVFSPSGAYLGRLKYNVVDSEPPGLAVDNSTQATQGRVYVTSGNTAFGSVYAYTPGAQTSAAIPAHSNPDLVFDGGSGGSSASVGGPASGGRAGGGAKAAEVGRSGALRVTLAGKLTPRSLPRTGRAPIAVSVGWKIASADGSAVPELRKVRIEINRHGHFDTTGLPVCPYDRIQPASSARALSACRSALVGQGTFSADIALDGQEPYATQGRLLVFNGRSHGKPVLLGQIYSPRPFATSFVIVFDLEDLGRGTYGTALTATLPTALASWGNLTAIEMKLSRRYRHAGEAHSFISAGCPAPKGFPGAVFPLARTSFDFSGGVALSSTLTRSCRAR